MNSRITGLEENGWYRVGNILLQWSTVTTVNGATKLWTFPKPFTGVFYKVVACRSQLQYEWTPFYSEKTSTGVRIGLSDKGDVWRSSEVDVLVIGY